MSWYLPQPSTPVPASTFTIPFAPVCGAAPAPRRRAPHPPYYIPRRMRPRHIRMREPAFSGLFTVSELDEMAAAGIDVCAALALDSASLSSDIDMDIDAFDVPLASSSSMSTLSTDSDSVATPSIHDEDGYFVDVPLDVDMEAEAADDDFFSSPSPPTMLNSFVSRLTKPRAAARRPAPLDLSAALHHRATSSLPYAAVEGINRWSREVDSLTPKLSSFPNTSELLPAFEHPSCSIPCTPTPTSSREADPMSALESLFGECAEPETSTLPSPSASSDRSRSRSPSPFFIPAFPMPPMHTPVLSPGSASTATSFSSIPQTPRTPQTPRRAFSGGATRHRSRSPITCPGAPSPKARRDKEKHRERVFGRTLQDKQAWATRHADLFSLTYSRAEGEASRSVSMPEQKRDRSTSIGLGISGVAIRRQSACASPASSYASSGSSKSRKLPSRPSLPAHWMV